MPKLKHIETGHTHQTDKKPVLLNGVWECGNVRFTDPLGGAYAIEPGVTLLVPDFWLCITLAEESKIRGSQDPLVVAWLRRMDDPRTKEVDTASLDLQSLLGRILTPDRVAQVIQGVRQ